MKRKVLWVVALVLVGSLAVGGGCARNRQQPLPPPGGQTGGSVPPSPSGEQHIDRTLTIDGIERTYTAYLPTGGGPHGVIFGLHGAGVNAESFEIQSRLQQFTNQYIIVYPQGYDNSWNAGKCCGAAMENGIDDVKFIRAILKDLATMTQVDHSRIYATGFSNGAMMTYVLACRMSDEIAAIAPVGGMMVLPPDQCKPARPVPVLAIHGLADEWAPFNGGMPKVKKVGTLPPVSQGVNFWSSEDGCTSTEPIDFLNGATCTKHHACRSGTDIILCTVDGLGHEWPGHQPRWIVERMMGPARPGVDGTDAVLKFFSEHTLNIAPKS